MLAVPSLILFIYSISSFPLIICDTFLLLLLLLFFLLGLSRWYFEACTSTRKSRNVSKEMIQWREERQKWNKKRRRKKKKKTNLKVHGIQRWIDSIGWDVGRTQGGSKRSTTVGWFRNSPFRSDFALQQRPTLDVLLSLLVCVELQINRIILLMQ